MRFLDVQCVEVGDGDNDAAVRQFDKLTKDSMIAQKVKARKRFETPLLRKKRKMRERGLAKYVASSLL
jgi:ribosomal protein S21